jgi:radical SAM superfamily enzyme YgiQ (UPF0313 family)
LGEGSLTVGAGPDLVVAADGEGRPWRVVDGSWTLRWGLNGRVLAVGRDPAGGRIRQWLELEAALARWEVLRRRLDPLFAQSARTPLELRWVPSAGEGPPPEGSEEQAHEALRRLAARDGEALRADAVDFARVYTPVGILPPDQYLAQVVQLTTGCSFNTCTFCTFYRDVPFHIRSPDELRIHMGEVDRLLGRGSSLRRSLFLGDANALVVPTPRLLELLEAVTDHYRERLADGSLDGLHAFLDGFSGARKSPADFASLRRLGLRRVTVGMESGHDPLLEWLHKPGGRAEVRAAVRAMKEAGLSVALIVLLGAGGRRFTAGHVRDTAELLAGLPLEAQDLVYFSEYVDVPGSRYGVLAAREGIEPLEREELQAQRKGIEAVLRPRTQGGPRTAVYDIREFTY